jgi:hypothetical protein
MVNICEPLINVATENKPKVLGCYETVEPTRAYRLGPKGKKSGIDAPNSPIADGVPPAERRNPWTTLSTGTPILSPDNSSVLRWHWQRWLK